MSNSKLETWQKIDLRMQKTWLKQRGGIVQTVGRCTVAIMPTSKTNAQIAWSIASVNEKRIRGIVGKHIALARLLNYPMPIELAWYDTDFVRFPKRDQLREIVYDYVNMIMMNS